MKKIFALLSITLLSSLLLKVNIRAQTSPTDPADREKIEGVREQVEKKVNEKLESIVTEDEKKSWNGIISSKNETNFELTTGQQSRTVSLNEEVEIIDENRQEISFEDLEQDQYVLAMGYEKIDGTLNARRIVVTEQYTPREKTSVHGTIVNKANGEKIVLVQNQEKEYELIFDNDTDINQKTESDIEEIDYEDLATDHEVIAVIEPADGETNSFNAVEVLVTTIKESPTPTEEE
jgi:hypothetical protein